VLENEKEQNREIYLKEIKKLKKERVFSWDLKIKTNK
jgi:hypothetical protein